MTRYVQFPRKPQLRLPFILMAILMILLWIGGGASRADAIGQVFARGSAWAVLITIALFAARPPLRSVSAIAILVLATIALVSLQLVPLPPHLWTALPGRELLEQAAVASGQDQPWRPLSISPGATVNALSSLIVPLVTLLLAASLSQPEQWRIAALLLSLVVASTLLGLIQFAGGHFDHPLVNDLPGSVSASFANRNHFALFAAFGCAIAPAWAFREGHHAHWKGPVALALLLLFVLIILASGSRTGIALGAIGGALGLFSVRRKIFSEFRQLPKRLSLALVAASVALIAGAIALSVALGRAVSLDRVFALDAGEDLRRQALPTVWEMTQLYFPFGSGVGTFDPVYRIHEPNELLNFAYFNHAHNDLLEVVLDAGLFGLILLLTAIAWWFWKSVHAWRSDVPGNLLPRIGSAILFLTLGASITDYPVRTPMIMAAIVIAAVWLNGSDARASAIRSAPRPEEPGSGRS